MLRYIQHLLNKTTPQSASARADQVKNSAGGFSFAIDPWQRLERFLILGSDGGTYYASERTLTLENAACVSECLSKNGPRAVSVIKDLSVSGRAPKNDAAIFALALGASHPLAAVRQQALAALLQVCRTGSHLFQFVQAVMGLRRWGRSLRTAVARWYAAKSVDDLALQLVKYAQREGMSHRDVLRLCHAKPASSGHQALFAWTVGKAEAGVTMPRIVEGYQALQGATCAREVATLIRSHRLTHEMVPSQWKNDREVWQALLQEMPLGALVRNLGKLTEVGVLAPLSEGTKDVLRALSDGRRLQAARLHPLTVLLALRTYASGHGVRGKLTWKPVPAVVDALDTAFYKAFRGIQPTGKRTLLGLDVSGSMTLGSLAGMPGITPRVASAAMAMATVRAESNWSALGFSDQLVEVPIHARMGLDEVAKAIERIPMGRTDCALPMIYARERRLPVDVFVIYTDNETWFGSVHPFQALRQYREATGIAAKLAVVGMTATGFTIADPTDAGMLDFVGFDAAAPAVLSDFARA